jgi:hypothetical protein
VQWRRSDRTIGQVLFLIRLRRAFAGLTRGCQWRRPSPHLPPGQLTGWSESCFVMTKDSLSADQMIMILVLLIMIIVVIIIIISSSKTRAHGYVYGY